MQIKMLIVIVLYGKKLEQSVAYSKIFQQCLSHENNEIKLYIHDNSIEKDEDAAIRSDIVYVHTPENRGLGYAYNEAAKLAIGDDFEWILLLDQDTLLPDSLLDSYFDAISHNPEIRLFVPYIQLSDTTTLSPGRIWKNPISIPLDKAYLLDGAMIINSGICINITLFFAVGGYNDRVWLDFSDTQFIRKVSHLEKVFYLIPAVCIQNFSGEEKNVDKLKKRFQIYLQCAEACQFIDLEDYLHRQWCILHHTLALTIRKRSLSFLKMFFSKYVV